MYVQYIRAFREMYSIYGTRRVRTYVSLLVTYSICAFLHVYFICELNGPGN